MMRVIRSTEGLQPVSSVWGELGHRSADTCESLFRTTVEARPEVEGPYVVTFDDPQHGVMFGRLEHQQLPLRAAFKTVARFKATVIAIVGEGLVDVSDEAPFVDEVLAAIERREADIVHFLGVRCDSDLESVLLARHRRLLSDVGEPIIHYSMSVSQGFDDTVASRESSARESIRRTRRKFSSAGDRMRIVRYDSDHGDPAALLAALEYVSARGYQRGLGVGFESDPLHEAFVGRGLAAGWYVAWVALLDGVPCAYWTSFVFDRTWTLHETAFDDASASLKPGAGLLGKVIEEACADPGVDTVYFGNGEARYKQEWADTSWTTREILFHAKRPKWIAFNVVQTGLSWAERTARRHLGAERVGELRRRVRRRAAETAKRSERSESGR